MTTLRHGGGAAITGWWAALALALLVVLGIARVAATYPVFSDTADERVHIATGLEWWQYGTYQIEDLHPPLARVAIAALPYLAGARLAHDKVVCPDSFVASHNRMKATEHKGFFATYCLSQHDPEYLYRDGRYDRILTLARIGNLPFFVLLCGYSYLLGSLLHGRAAGLVTAFVVSMSPAILAHAGVATTDLAFAALFVAFAYHLLRWLRGPSPGRALAAGTAAGLCAASKFSALLFGPVLVVACLALLPLPRLRLAVLSRHLLAFGAAALLVLWGLYLFTLGKPSEVFPAAAGYVAESAPGDRVAAALQAPVVPAPALWQGIQTSSLKNQKGHAWYILGRQLDHKGVWYFFPVALFFKTPLAIWALALVAVAELARRQRRRREDWLPVAALAGILVATMPTDINIGVRHVLIAYPLLGLLIAGLWPRAATPTRLLAVPLAAWLVWSGAQAHPDYLAYFNAAAGDRPEEILVDSDLDWGQDKKRLVAALQRRGVAQATLCGYGLLYFHRQGFPGMTHSCPDRPPEGWFAIRKTFVVSGGFEARRWLAAYEPVEAVGHSILLYHFPRHVEAARD